MPGLLAAKNIATPKHLFENVAVADIGASRRDAFASEGALESQIGHGSSNDTVAGKFVLRFQVARSRQQNAVAIHDLAGRADEEGTVGVTIEGDAHRGTLGDDALLQSIEVERAAFGVDVTAVG